MSQRGCDFDLAQKPLAAERGGQIGTQHLERHLAVVLEIFGQIDHSHAAAADLAFDGVTVDEGCLQAGKQVCAHGCSTPVSTRYSTRIESHWAAQVGWSGRGSRSAK